MHRVKYRTCRSEIFVKKHICRLVLIERCTAACVRALNMQHPMSFLAFNLAFWSFRVGDMSRQASPAHEQTESLPSRAWSCKTLDLGASACAQIAGLDLQKHGMTPESIVKTLQDQTCMGMQIKLIDLVCFEACLYLAGRRGCPQDTEGKWCQRGALCYLMQSL